MALSSVGVEIRVEEIEDSAATATEKIHDLVQIFRETGYPGAISLIFDAILSVAQWNDGDFQIEEGDITLMDKVVDRLEGVFKKEYVENIRKFINKNRQ